MSVSKKPSASTVVNTYSENPPVSIVIPTYNEVENIESVVNSFLASKYSNLAEIVIIDGQSNDGTKERLRDLAHAYPKIIRVVENPQRFQSAALNIGLKICQGEVFLRADAHCDYAPNYVEKCVETLLQTEAINVGGAQRFVAASPFQAGVAIASKSFFGSGGAKYRDPNYNGFADTVFLGCFWRSDLESVGGYDENSTPNEDAELNIRLRQIAPNPIYISSEIKVWYFPRRTWKDLWIQYFRYGQGRYMTTIRHPERSQIRGKLPFLFFSTMFLLLIFDLFSAIELHIPMLYLAGVAIALLESVRVNLKLKDSFDAEIWRGNARKSPSMLSRCFYGAVAIMTLPLAHSCGYGYQTIQNFLHSVKH